MSKFEIFTLGCKVNQYESESISQEFQNGGWSIARGAEQRDLCIINTCTVTGKASMQSRQEIRKIIRKNPNAVIVVTGCYAQTEASEIKKIEGVDLVASHTDKHKIAGHFLHPERSTMPSFPENDQCTETVFKAFPPVKKSKRTRPFLKIQDGCNAFCTYCIVPYARGRSRSMPPEELFQSLETFAQSNYHEIVLTGIHVGCYGKDIEGSISFFKLLKEIDQKKIIDRIRLSSIEPMEITDEIVELVAGSDRFCNHFHIPLQSGDDKILERMKRPYRQKDFIRLVRKINDEVPDAFIGIDILIGFPGETDEQFKNTYDLLKGLPVTYLHIFPYSRRKNTPAADYENQVPPDVIKDRCDKMRDLCNLKKRAFLERCVGNTEVIVVENKRDGTTNYLKGVSSNYITVLVQGDDSLKNTLCKVKIENINDNCQALATLLTDNQPAAQD